MRKGLVLSLFFLALAAALSCYSFGRLLFLGVDSRLLLVHGRTVAIWGAFYVLAYSKWRTFTPFFVLVCFGLYEFLWNSLFYSHLGIAGLRYIASGGNAPFYAIVMTLAYAGFLVLNGWRMEQKHRIKLRPRWALGIAIAAGTYYAAGCPTAWFWLVGFNLAMLPFLYKLLSYNSGLRILEVELANVRP